MQVIEQEHPPKKTKPQSMREKYVWLEEKDGKYTANSALLIPPCCAVNERRIEMIFLQIKAYRKLLTQGEKRNHMQSLLATINLLNSIKLQIVNEDPLLT